MHAPQLIFHITAAITFSYAIYFDVYFVSFPLEIKSHTTEFAGRLKYLTFLNAVLQLVFYWLCTFNDIFGTNSKTVKERHILQRIRDYLFGTVVFPIAMFVALTFWGLWAVDRELVYPKVLDAVIPSWLNHIMHTSIVGFSLMESIFVPKVYPNRSKALKGTIAAMAAYIAWVFLIAFHTGFWVYPILEVLSWPLRTVFITVCAAIASFLCIIGELLHLIRWGKMSTLKTVSKNTSKGQSKGPVKGGSNGKRQSKKD